MKKLLFFLVCAVFALVWCDPAFAQEVINVENPPDVGWSFDFSTFAGIVAIVSLAVTQCAKIIPFVSQNTFAKIASSVLVASVLMLIAWHFELAEFLAGLTFWNVILQGLLAGLSSCGIYDLVKNVLKLKWK
jgi:uncharacterized membrane protein